jgi:flavin reductase (DIM6/NTAB) family NADH-FMN oxidoreductase RutF
MRNRCRYPREAIAEEIRVEVLWGSVCVMSIFNLTNPEIYVITAAQEGQMGGQVTTWVTLATLIPEQLRVVAVISPRNFTFPLIQKSQRFVVNLLAADQAEWLPHFGLRSQREFDKFAGIPYTTTPQGIPLLPNTCGWADCIVVESVDRGDRVVLIADVIDQMVFPDRKPLRRVEALAALPSEVTQALAEKRSLDIEVERKLRESWEAGSTGNPAHPRMKA